MMIRLSVVSVFLITLLATPILAGQQGRVLVPQVGDGAITIDGSSSDWNLGSYTTVSEQPEFPEARDLGESDALGDHIVYDQFRVNHFGGGFAGECNAGGECPTSLNGEGDFQSTVYMAWDSTALYFLGVFKDDVLQNTLDETEFGDNTFRNDGFEIFVDANNDTDDGVTDLGNPPNSQFDDEEPNLDDFQISFGLNENFPDGARQHMERAGQPGFIGGTGPGEPYEEFVDIVVGERNGPGGLYRDALDTFGKSIAASTTDDGYILEAAVPWGFADLNDDGDATNDWFGAVGKEFGFSLFWNDQDNDTDADLGVGDTQILRMFWTQASVFDGDQWATAELTGAVGPTGDYNGSGQLDAGDLDVHAQYVIDSNPAGDVDGDGDTDNDDRLAWVKDLQGSWLGDSDFSGEFNSSDLVAVFAAGLYETGQAAGYAAGDWNGDMVFNSSDLVAAFTDGGYEQGPLGAAVPEPAGVVLFVFGLLGLVRLPRK